jgi:beta-glucosidase
LGGKKKSRPTTLFDRGYAGALGWQWVDWAQNRENNYNSWPNILINMQNVKTLHPEAVTMARGITPVSSTASSVQGNNTANKAVDGKLNSRWESAWSDPQWFQVDLGSTHLINRLRICWEYASAKSYNIQVSANGSSWTTVYSTTSGRGGVETLTFPSIYARYVRINGTTRNTKYGYSIWEFDVYAAPNVARGKTVTASSNENGSLTPDKAVDAKSNTRWASAWADPQWYQVDLGATYTIDRIRIFWEAAAAKAFNIQVSANGISWTTVYSTTNGPGGTQDLKITPRTARYVRMNGISRKTIYGYSFWEFEVY